MPEKEREEGRIKERTDEGLQKHRGKNRAFQPYGGGKRGYSAKGAAIYIPGKDTVLSGKGGELDESVCG